MAATQIGWVSTIHPNPNTVPIKYLLIDDTSTASDQWASPWPPTYSGTSQPKNR